MSSPPPRAAREHLTSLRFFAALLVVLFHMQAAHELSGPWQWLSDLSSQGFSGVSFFFILSGYIISYAYQQRLSDKRIAPGQFLLARVIRIWPLHVVCAVLLIGLSLWRGTELNGDVILTNLLLLQSFSGNEAVYFSLNAVSWSLSDELFFYVMFLALAPLPSRVLMTLYLVLLGVLVITLQQALKLGDGRLLINGVKQPAYWTFYINPFFRLLDFMTGMLIFRFALPSLTRLTQSGLELMSVILLLSVMLLATWTEPAEALRAQLLFLPVMALVIATFAAGGGLLSDLLSHRWLVLLGNASFALYMTHHPLVYVLEARTRSWSMTTDPMVSVLLLCTVCVTVSVLVYRCFEKPVHDYLKARLLHK